MNFQTGLEIYSMNYMKRNVVKKLVIMKMQDSENYNPVRIKTTTCEITFANRWDHFLARLGIKRNERRVEPGLYKIGNPTSESPVFVTANYRLSFDALRSNLSGIDGYILVLNTFGINIWCAAGKGTFGTGELIRQINETELLKVIDHKKLILPQLGAAGVSAHRVKNQTGFNIEYGPVFANDLKDYLKTHLATPEMRKVKFSLKDRFVLIPVELTHFILPMALAAVMVYFISGYLPMLSIIAATLAGVVLFPILLPWLPTADFSSKGFILGVLIASPFIFLTFTNSSSGIWQKAGISLSYFLILPAVTAFLTLNFTGSTTFTSRSGVEKEIFTYFPIMVWMFGIGLLLSLSLIFTNLF